MKVFISSSGDLAEERVKLETLLNRMDFKPFLWEAREQAITDEEFQARLNRELANSHIAIFMVKTRFGQYTKEEFNFAYRNLGQGIKKIYVYFLSENWANIDFDQLINISNFKKSIEDKKSIYKDVNNYEALENHLLKQIPYWEEPQINNNQNQVTNKLMQTVPAMLPNGQVPKDSNFYIDRDDFRAYDALINDYSLIRIKAPMQYGKTLLMSRLIVEAKKRDYNVVALDFQGFPSNILNNLEDLLNEICQLISLKVNIEPNINKKRLKRLSPTARATQYVELILRQSKVPIVLAIDEIDKLFEYSDISNDFFGLIRSWHEESKYNDDWNKLKMIVSYSRDPLLFMKSFHNSPFDNVGLGMELKAFNIGEIESLARMHNLTINEKEIELLQTYIGGHPSLTGKVLNDMATENIGLVEALKIERFNHHLSIYLHFFQKNKKLIEAIKNIPNNNYLDIDQCYILESMGFVTHSINNIKFSCELYKEFFEKYFGEYKYEE